MVCFNLHLFSLQMDAFLPISLACLYECPGSIYCSNHSVSGGVNSGGGDSKMLKRFYAKVSCDERGTCRQVSF